jgi:ABC-type oligopeptide transport system substrate-binding subunit
VTRAGEAPAYGLVPPIVPNYRRQTASFMSNPLDQRLAEARQLFAKAGYSPMQPLSIEILFNTSENNSVIAESVIGMWDAAFGKGIVVKPVSVDRTEYLKRRARRDFQVVRAAWIGDYADPTVFLNLLLSTALPPRNDPGYQNKKFDELLARAGATEDTGQRAEILGEAEKMMIEDYPIIPIYHFATKSLVNPNLKGWAYNVRDVHPSRFLSFGDKPAS